MTSGPIAYYQAIADYVHAADMVRQREAPDVPHEILLGAYVSELLCFVLDRMGHEGSYEAMDKLRQVTAMLDEAQRLQ